jgi:FAD/FMN-containing dehydrogenase
MKPRRRDILAGAALLPLAVRSVGAAASEPLTLNDASRLNPTIIGRRANVRSPLSLVAEAMRAELKAAKAEGRAVCVGGARHSMGGQSLPPTGGTAVDFTGAAIEIDSVAKTYRVGAGARWREVIAGLDPAGLSPAVAQSSNDFAVGAAVSVNAHGWPAPRGPVGSTVRALTVMTADGELVTCSPTREVDLFRLVVGGYGLAAIVLEAELEAAANVQLAPRYAPVAGEAAGQRFATAVLDPSTRMAYARLDVRKGGFLKEGLVCTYAEAGAAGPLTGAGSQEALAGSIFRAQTGSEAGKGLRWFSEAKVLPAIAGQASRNSLLNTPVAALGQPRRGFTDILHEYLLPVEGVASFLAACRREIPGLGVELLNITLRYVQADDTSLLGYAPGDRIAAVMFFDQKMTNAAEAAMRRLTERLIDAALDAGGSYYLPYRLHARADQLRRAYPNVEAFAAAKRRLDPGLLLRNQMWDRYFSEA